MRWLPVALPASGLLAVLSLLTVGLQVLTPSAGLAGGVTPGTPAEYAPHVLAAASSCDGVPVAVLSAQLEQESGWRPHAVSAKGAVGLAQFLPRTWVQFGVDGDGDGTADARNPVDAIYGAARYDCYLKTLVSGLGADPVPLVLAAYNAGPAAVLRARGVPPFPETQAYVRAILERAYASAASGSPDGLTPNAFRIRELVRRNFGITDYVGFATDGHTKDSDHYTGRALDVMLTPTGPSMTSLGWRIALYLQANARTLSITYLIWQGRIWSLGRNDEGWRPYTPPSGQYDPTHMHMDHVHVSVR